MTEMTPPAQLTVAVAQIECQPGALAANLQTHLDAIEQARSQKVDLLVFPELSLTDYLFAPDCQALALRRDDPVFDRLADSLGQMLISAGFIERAAQGGFFNAQALLSARGVHAVHRKINLPGYGKLREDRVYRKGESLVLQALPAGWCTATLICADSWNPALPWLAALAGAQLLIVAAASACDAVGGDFDNPRGWEINLLHTALTYGLPTIFANHCGERSDSRFWGGSRILDATGRELVRAGAGPQLIVSRIDRRDGAAARTRLPTMRDSDPERIARLLAQIHPESREAERP